MQPVAIFLLAWSALCLWVARRAGGPRLLMLPMVLLLPGALTPVYLVFAYPEYHVAPGQFVGSILLMGCLALAVRRRSGPFLAVIAMILALPMLTSFHKIMDQATRVPVAAFVFAARASALVVIFYIVQLRQDILRTQLPGSRWRDGRPGAEQPLRTKADGDA